MYFFFLRTSSAEIYTLSLHDALPIYLAVLLRRDRLLVAGGRRRRRRRRARDRGRVGQLLGPHLLLHPRRSEEHTSELQSLRHLVCRLLLEKKNPIRLT